MVGQIDALVTAAGVAASGAVHATELKDWQLVHDVNLTGTFLSVCIRPREGTQPPPGLLRPGGHTHCKRF